jgi:molecular chaperone DnaK (HSP70)
MTVLFSPLGLSYGTLYSAILLVRPQLVVVITSPQAERLLHPAIDAARFYYSGFCIETCVLSDPFAGFSEGRQLARQLSSLAGEDNIVNLTGGTTVLQDCARSIADILRAEGRAVREVAVVDGRDGDEQARQPLVLGQLVEVPPL